MPKTHASKLHVDDARPTDHDGDLRLLAGGDHVRMRVWAREQPGKPDEPHSHGYETVGYVVSGRARLHCEGRILELGRGDSWVVPADAEHHYEIVEPFTAIEAVSTLA